MIEAEKLKKMMEDNKNGIPKDRNGEDIIIGRIAEAKVTIKPRKVELNGKTWSLGPKVTKICGKILIVGLEASWIQPENEEPKEVRNGKITIIV